MKTVLETFKPIKGYEGIYEVSDYGCVRSRYGGKVSYRKCKKTKYGYICVPLSKNGKKIFFYVHRLVYTAFNGPIPEGMQIDHIDGDKSNNKLTNLRAVSPKVNSNNPITRVRYLEAIKKRTLSEQWSNNVRDGAKRRAGNPQWRNNVRKAAKRRSESQAWQQKNREAAKRRVKDQDWRNSVREGVRRVCAKPIVQLDVKTGEVIRRWECARDAERKLKINNSSISQCCQGKRKSAGGYRWCFAFDNAS